MKKQTQDQFRKDILKVTKAQNEKIEKLEFGLREGKKILEEVRAMMAEATENIKQGTQVIQAHENPAMIACYITLEERVTPEELQRRATEVAKEIKPIMEKYRLSKIEAMKK